MTDPTDIPPPSIAVGSELAVVNTLLYQMGLMEGRIVKRLEAQSTAAKERWGTHEDQHARWETELEKLREAIDCINQVDHDDEVRFLARVGPLQKVVSVAFREWRTIAIFVGFIATWLGMAEFIDSTH